MKKTFSVFETAMGLQGATQTTPTKTLNFSELINYYNSDENKKLSEAILNATPEKQKELKALRAYYTPYGEFSYRNNASILNHNAVISIDIDGLQTTAEAIKIKNKLSKHKSTLFSVLSTRGKGVKALMAVNATYTPNEQYKQLKHVFIPYLAEFLKLDAGHIDTAQFVLSQPCYFSYDAEMYVNENAEPLELIFDYKEPERAPFTPTKVPTGATSRVDAYILGTLNKKIATLTNIGARHPKLYGAKLLGQLLHYAPHLENEIVSSFIEAGIAMYGTERMRANVTNTVNDAFRDGVNEPINNDAIESILNELKAPTKPIAPQTNYYCNYQYLNEDKELIKIIEQKIATERNLIINAPTGAGKTTLFKTIAENFKEKVIFVAPLKTIVEQQAGQYPTILEGTTPEEITIAMRYKLCFTTYSSLQRLGDITGKIVIIDESHLLSNRANILYDEIKALIEILGKTKSNIFLSATTNPLLSHILNTKQINITTKAPTRLIQPLFYTKGTSRLDAIINHLSQQGDEIKVLFFNDKTKLETIRLDLIKLGIFKENEIVKFTADAVDIKTADYKELNQLQMIKDGVKLILCTSKIGEGVNVNNTNSFNLLFVGATDTDYLTQGLGRFRKAKSLQINVLFPESFKEKPGFKTDNFKLYDQLLNEILRVPKLMNDFSSLENIELPYINVDWKERGIVYNKDGESRVNSFEIMHQIKAIEESNYNFEIWKNALKLKIKNVKFLEAREICQAQNKDLQATRTERKKETQNFLSAIRKRLNTNDAGAILYEVMNATRNKKLKGFIHNLLYDFIEANHLTENEKIMFFSNYQTIEGYILNIQKIMQGAELSFTDGAILFNSDENYKTANFNTLLKRIVIGRLKEKGTANIEQAKTMQAVQNIENVFYPMTKEGIVYFTKNELFTIFRKKLGYRNRTENIEVVKSKIGFLFDVQYCRKNKIFTLKKGDTLSFTLYQQNKKYVPTQRPIFKGQNVDF